MIDVTKGACRERRTPRAPDVAEMGVAALPRKSGELACVIAAVGEAECDDPENPTRGYYESWLVSLERLLEQQRLLEG